MDTRLQDYLEDKFQSSADLESVDTLLQSLKAQHDIFQKQVGDRVYQW